MVSLKAQQKAVRRLLASHPDRHRLLKLHRLLQPRLFLIEFKKIVKETNWPALTRRLVLDAGRRMRRYRWRGNIGNLPGGAPDAAFFAADAVAKLFTHERRFIPSACTVEAWLFGVLRSLISHAAAYHENQTIHDDVFVEGVDRAAIEQFAPYALDEEVIAKEQADHFIDRLPEPELRAYVRLRLSGLYDTAEDYAKALGVPVSVIRNMNRVLARRRALWDC